MAHDQKKRSVWSRLLGRAAPLVPSVEDETPPFRTGRAPETSETNQQPVEDASETMATTGDFFAKRFGLTQRAFTLLPDPDFLFWSAGHKRAYSILEYGIMTRSPITVMTGDVGAGKTTLLQALLEKVSEDTVIGLISNAHGNRGDLLRWALAALDVPFDRDASYVEIFQTLQDFLIQNYAQGRYTILIIDEAQQLTQDGLEELRMLTNINSKKDELLQLVLIGQPELRSVIARPEMQQFAQRIMATYHLRPMNQEETTEYIRHRLVRAGGRAEQFTSAAIEKIFTNTQGVPRLINKLCDFAIVYAATVDLRVVDVDIVNNVISDGLLHGATDVPVDDQKLL